jgi:hypothetical protein
MFNPLRIKLHNLFSSVKSVFKKKPRELGIINPYMTEYGSKDTRRQRPEKTAIKLPSFNFSFPIIKEMEDVIKGDLMWLWYKTKAGKRYLADRRLKQDAYERCIELMVGKKI